MARVREIAACNIIQATAISRLQRAHTHKTVSSLERFENQPGDLVDIWYEPTRNDHGGGRGPAEIKTINEDEAHITVRFQGRSLDRRLQEVRPHVPYFIYLFEDSLAYTMTDAWKMVVGFVENMSVGFATCDSF